MMMGTAYGFKRPVTFSDGLVMIEESTELDRPFITFMIYLRYLNRSMFSHPLCHLERGECIDIYIYIYFLGCPPNFLPTTTTKSS